MRSNINRDIIYIRQDLDLCDMFSYVSDTTPTAGLYYNNQKRCVSDTDTQFYHKRRMHHEKNVNPDMYYDSIPLMFFLPHFM